MVIPKAGVSILMPSNEENNTPLTIIDPISEALDLVPIDDPNKESKGYPSVADEPVQDDIKTDYEYSRKRLRELIEKGNQALDSAIGAAAEVGKPESFEAIAKTIKILSEVTKDLYDIHIKTKALEQSSQPKSYNEQQLEKQESSGQAQPINIDKAVFVGTTAELIEQIRAGTKALPVPEKTNEGST
jgi:hypothetical protein